MSFASSPLAVGHRVGMNERTGYEHLLLGIVPADVR